MTDDFINNYFIQEKIESLIFAIIGLVAISVSFIFWFIIKYSFYKGMAYPIFIIGFIQILVGGVVYMRSPQDIIRVEQILKFEPIKMKTEEIPRINKVIKNFEIYKWIEICFIFFGSILFIFCKKTNLSFWKGIGLGLLIQAMLMLALDIVAEKRAKIYCNIIQKI